MDWRKEKPGKLRSMPNRIKMTAMVHSGDPVEHAGDQGASCKKADQCIRQDGCQEQACITKDCYFQIVTFSLSLSRRFFHFYGRMNPHMVYWLR